MSNRCFNKMVSVGWEIKKGSLKKVTMTKRCSQHTFQPIPYGQDEEKQYDLLCQMEGRNISVTDLAKAKNNVNARYA